DLTVDGAVLERNRQVRAGAAYAPGARGSVSLIAAVDADLTTTRTAGGVDRHLAGGAELRVARVGFRGGLSVNTSDDRGTSANGGKLGFNLVKMGFVKDEEITALLSKQYGVPSINLTQFELDPAVIKLIPPDTANKYQIVPLSRSGATLTIAMTDPTNVFAMDDIKFMTGYNVEPVVASEAAVTAAIQKYYSAAKARRAAESGPGAVPSGPSTLEMATRGL